MFSFLSQSKTGNEGSKAASSARAASRSLVALAATVSLAASLLLIAPLAGSPVLSGESAAFSGVAPLVKDVFGSTKAYAAKPKISVAKKTLASGKSLTLKVKGTSKTASKKATWRSSNKKVATVSKKGKVVAKAVGKATITCKVAGRSLRCKITVVPALNRTSATIYAGSAMALKVKGVSANKVKWSSSAPAIASVSASGKVSAKNVGSATITAKAAGKTLKCKVRVELDPWDWDDGYEWDWGDDDWDDDGDGDGGYIDPGVAQAELVKKVSSYSYKISVINPATNDLVFVETDNPDPLSFQLADDDSIYLDKGKTALFKPMCRTFADVNYTDKGTRRVSDKGYIFYCESADSDGGTLRLLANKGYYYEVTSWGASYSDGVNYDTKRTVSAPAMTYYVDYLVKRFADPVNGSFFDKMDAVQKGLVGTNGVGGDNSIALYPKSLLDTDKPYASGGFPCLATSPYPELGLNKHIETMYERAENGLFLEWAHGFVLDSLGTPGTLSKVAKRLQPACEVKGTGHHALIDVTYNGETQRYGGNGRGGSDPLYSKFVDWEFRFDGTDVGYGTALSIDVLGAARDRCAERSNELAEGYLAKISDAAVLSVAGGNGEWMRCAVEGSGSSTVCYAYKNAWKGLSWASDAWVDGRYVNSNERYVQGARFADHPKADIILRDVTWTKRNGDAVTRCVEYVYDADKDEWRASTAYYNDGVSYGSDKDLAEAAPELVLTRAEVEGLVANGTIDGKTDEPPNKGYIFDGSAEPGSAWN